MKDQIIHIAWLKIDFKCPHCNKKNFDEHDKYYKRLEKSKKGYIRLNCECGERFGLAVDMTRQYVGFKLN